MSAFQGPDYSPNLARASPEEGHPPAPLNAA